MYIIAGGKHHQIGEVTSLEEGDELYKKIQQVFNCDVYIEDKKGRTWMATAEGWQDSQDVKRG